MARAIHNLSSRKGKTMVKVNCAALPATLIESELFGREKGAYTGALTKQIGRFEAANGSTIFLDEIGELPLELQAKLLRVLQEGQFERLGSTQTINTNVRVVAATNRDLAQAVKEGKFREDLYYRLNVFPISVPPLRERKEDIPVLIWAFVREFSAIMGKSVESISKTCIDACQRYSWPGNVRELRNVVERAMILSKSPTLHLELPRIPGATASHATTLNDIERQHILTVMKNTGWRVRGKGGAAEVLGLKPTTLDSKLQKLNIKRGPQGGDRD
jgi:transcriptional regulator with GAF, ATPase, and Fis domain